MESMKREKYVIFGLVGKKTVVLKPSDLRALAFLNANAIFKPFLTIFYGSKCAASKDAKHRNCKKFYNSATVQFYL